jgi:DNA topoisomerase-1
MHISEITTLTIGGGAFELRATGSVKFDGFMSLLDKKDFAEEKSKKVPYLAERYTFGCCQS